jgi:hypothetical protein
MNIVFSEVKKVLMQLQVVLENISESQYTTPLPVLSNSSIGEHTRHIIELFQCLEAGYENGVVNYDNRKRNKTIQTDLSFAIDCIAAIINGVKEINKTMQMETLLAEDSIVVETNYYRELVYNIEHCVHHQAIIKIGLESIGAFNAEQNFGVAASTIQYKNQCAQ